MRHASPDLVIIDIDLPDSDGYQTLGAIKETSDVPVIVICGAEDEETISRILKSGADDVITSPFGASDLLTCLADLLKKLGMKLALRFNPPH